MYLFFAIIRLYPMTYSLSYTTKFRSVVSTKQITVHAILSATDLKAVVTRVLFDAAFCGCSVCLSFCSFLFFLFCWVSIAAINFLPVHQCKVLGPLGDNRHEGQAAPDFPHREEEKVIKG